MSKQTAKIIKAAKGWSTWGRYAAERYAVKRGLDLRLVRLARQLESIKGV